MRKRRLLLSLTACIVFSGCGRPALERLSECPYAGIDAEERQFVLPTFEEYNAGPGTPIYSAPDRSARIPVSSWTYERELAGKRYKRTDIVEGRDGRYVRWVMEDCRLFFTPEEDE